jgi:hypothetical protein
MPFLILIFVVIALLVIGFICGQTYEKTKNIDEKDL